MGVKFLLSELHIPLWLILILLITILFVFFIVLQKQRNNWLSELEQTRIISRNQIDNLSKKNDHEKRSLQSKANAEIKRIQQAAETEIETMREQFFNENEALKKHSSDEISRISHECDEKLLIEQQRSALALRLEKERIEAEHNDLLVCPEKELLVKTVMALSGFASRIDRLESQSEMLNEKFGLQGNSSNELRLQLDSLRDTLVSSINHSDAHISSFQETLHKSLTEQKEVLHKTESISHSIFQASNEAIDRINDLNEKLCELHGEDACSSIDEISSDMESAMELLKEMKGYGYDASLTRNEEKLSEIYSLLEDLRGYDSFVTITDVKNLIDELKSKFDED